MLYSWYVHDMNPDGSKGSSHRRYSVKKAFLKISQNLQENNFAGLRACNALKRDSSTGVFLQYCETFKNTYFEEHLRVIASKVKLNCFGFPLGYH